MVSSPEKEHPLIERRIEEPGELERLAEERRELEGYIERVERTPKKEPVTDDGTGQAVLTPSQSQPVTVTLPLTEEEIKHGLHHKIVDSMRWLSEWCWRITKKALVAGIGVVYRKD